MAGQEEQSHRHRADLYIAQNQEKGIATSFQEKKRWQPYSWDKQRVRMDEMRGQI